jgi:AraC-like DNA-binding protein/tetratricopeptide (TPR) repeat protein
MLQQGQLLKGFVGRIKESKQLGRLFSESLEHGAKMVLISGETGIGKTALLGQLRGNVAAREGYYLVCKSGQLGSPFPYHPLAELLRVLVGELKQDQVKEVAARYSPRVLAELSLLVPNFSALINTTHRITEQTGNLPDKLFLDNACCIARDLLKNKPVVLILEDIPYADPTSLEVLQYMLQHQEDFPVLICGTYDLDDIDLANGKFTPFRNFIRALNYENALTRINLDSLSREEAGVYMSFLLEDKRLPDELLDTVFQKSEGNPLVIKHLVQKLINNNNLQKKCNGWEFSRPLIVDLPEEISEMFLIRLEGIRPELKNVLSIAAVIGRKFSVQTLSPLLDISLKDLIPLLEEALHLHLIEEQHYGVQNYFSFVSSRLQEVLYENLCYQRKLLLHQQVGLLLEQTIDFRTQPDEFAYHFQWGTDKAKAVKYAILAGQRAISLCAFHSAWRYFSNAKDLFPLLDESTILAFRHHVLEGLAESACFLGYYSDARKCLGQLLGSGTPEGNHAYGSVQFKLGELCFRMGNFPETLEHYYLSLQYGDDSQKAVSTIRIIQTYVEMGRFDEASSLANLQLERAIKLGNQSQLTEIYAILTSLYTYTGDIKKAVEYAEKLKLCSITNELSDIIVQAVLGSVSLEVGPLVLAKEQLETALNLAIKLQDPLIIGQLEVFLARVLILEGRIDEAQESLYRAKSMQVYSHSFILKENVLRQQILAETLGGLAFIPLLEELEEVWEGKGCSAFGFAISAKRVEIAILSENDQGKCSRALEELKNLQSDFLTPRNLIYLLRAEAAYQLKFASQVKGREILFQIIDLCEQYGLNSEGLITAHLWPELLEEKLEQFQNLLQINTVSAASKKRVLDRPQGQIPSEVASVLKYIHEQYCTDISVANLCNIANLSERQLRRLFTQFVGVSIKEYINNFRIERAEELLTNPTLGINQVGQLVGIGDKTHFCRTFKAIVGVSPSEYRKRQLENVRNGQQLGVTS